MTRVLTSKRWTETKHYVVRLDWRDSHVWVDAESEDATRPAHTLLHKVHEVEGFDAREHEVGTIIVVTTQTEVALG